MSFTVTVAGRTYRDPAQLRAREDELLRAMLKVDQKSKRYEEMYDEWQAVTADRLGLRSPRASPARSPTGTWSRGAAATTRAGYRRRTRRRR